MIAPNWDEIIFHNYSNWLYDCNVPNMHKQLITKRFISSYTFAMKMEVKFYQTSILTFIWCIMAKWVAMELSYQRSIPSFLKKSFRESIRNFLITIITRNIRPARNISMMIKRICWTNHTAKWKSKNWEEKRNNVSTSTYISKIPYLLSTVTTDRSSQFLNLQIKNCHLSFHTLDYYPINILLSKIQHNPFYWLLIGQ